MIFILDKRERIVATIKNSGGALEAPPFFDDVLTQDLATGAETFVFTTVALGRAVRYLTIGNYVAFKKDGNYKLFQIMRTQEWHDDTVYITVYSECAGLELINKIFRKTTLNSCTLQKFMETVINDTGWTLGGVTLNEKAIDLELEDSTVYATLQNTLPSFGVELEFTVTINQGRISRKVINIHSSRGKVTAKRFVFGQDIESIERTVDSTELFTAMIGRGKNGLSFSDVMVEGIEKPLGQDFVEDKDAFNKYNHNGYHIMGIYEFITESPEELLRETHKALQQHKFPKIAYELDVALLGELLGQEWNDISIGDTVSIVDNSFNPPIHLMARVSKLELSMTNPQANKCTLANFIEVRSNITDEMRKLAASLEGYVDNTVDTKFPIGGEDIQDGAITTDKVYKDTIITDHLIADCVTADKIKANSITADHIVAGSITADKINATVVEAVEGKFDKIDVKLANIDHIFAGNITADMIQTGTITAGSGVIANGAIGNAQISNLNANKINAGTIDTSLVNVASQNSEINITGNQILINDSTNPLEKINRVTLGQYNTTTGTEYGLLIRGEDGQTVMIDSKTGVHNAGITDGSIDNNKINDSAGIEGFKLDINSVIREVNDKGGETINSTKIQVGDRTLDVELSSQSNLITENKTELSTQKSMIQANTEQINLKVDNQTYITDKETIEGSISSNKEELKKHTSSIEILQDEIKTKVENTTVTNIKKELENKITENTTNIANNKAEITQTVDKIKQEVSSLNTTTTNIRDDLNNVDNKVTTVNNKVTSLETGLDGITAKVEDVQIQVSETGNKLDNLEIGGRNILGNSEYKNKAEGWTLSNSDACKVQYIENDLEGYTSACITATNNDKQRYGGIKKILATPKFKPDEEYTVSAWVFISSEVAMDAGATLEVKGRLIEEDRELPIGGVDISAIEKDKWVYVHGTFTVTKNFDGVHAYFYVTKNGKYKVAKGKIEKGNKATDYTPAPEDVDDTFKKISYKISKIEQNADGITSTVSKLKTTVNNLQIGGSNYISTSNLSTHGGEMTKADKYKDIPTFRLRTLSTNVLNNLGIKITSSIALTSDETSDMTLSFYYFAKRYSNQTSKNMVGYIRVLYDDNSQQTFEYDKLIANLVDQVNWGKWHRLEFTFTTNATKKLKAISNFYFYTDYANSSEILVTSPKLEFGNKATEWSVSNEELENRFESAESQIKQSAEEIKLTVKKGKVMSAIEQSSESIKISANKIDLRGYVTFTNLSTNGQTTIDGGNIKTRSIDANRIQAGSISAYEIAGATITASEIKARTITASKIATGTLTANEIASNTITASEIRTGTITANQIAGNTITGAEIKAGTITANHLAAGSISANKISGGTLSGVVVSGVVIKGSDFESGSITTQNFRSAGSCSIEQGLSVSGALTVNRMNSGSGGGISCAGALSCGGGFSCGTISASLNTNHGHRINGGCSFGDDVAVHGGFHVVGAKNRIVTTENHGLVAFNAYETTTCLFGDVGRGKLVNGECKILINEIFKESVSLELGYDVFITKYGRGDIWVQERNQEYFVVQGDSDIEFSWEIKAIQKGYENHKLERFVMLKNELKIVRNLKRKGK